MTTNKMRDASYEYVKLLTEQEDMRTNSFILSHEPPRQYLALVSAQNIQNVGTDSMMAA